MNCCLALAIQFNLAVAKESHRRKLWGILGQISRGVGSVCQKPATLTPSLCIQGHRWLAKPLCQGTEQNHYALSNLSCFHNGQTRCCCILAWRGDETAVVHVCLVCFREQRGLSPPLCAARTLGASSAVDLSWWLLSDSTALRNSPAIPHNCRAVSLLPPSTFTCWLVGFCFFPCDTQSLRKELLYFTTKNDLRPLVIFVRY